MFHRLNDKGDNWLTEIPGCPEKRIPHNGENIYVSILFSVHPGISVNELSPLSLGR
jgi:hypothetical protein